MRRNHPPRVSALEKKFPKQDFRTRDADEVEWRAHCLEWLLMVKPGGVQEAPPMTPGALRHQAWLESRPGKRPTHGDAVRALMKAVPPSRGAP